jgi:flagellin
MAFDLLTNTSSLQAQNYLNTNLQFQSKTIAEVTSGQRIVNAGDDAAGLAVANTYRSDEAVLTQGISNANDGLATLQTIDGGMSNISQLLDRASTLAAQSASGTFQGSRSVLNNEFQNVLTEINRQAQSMGMTQGGQFAQNMQVFIGGGRSDSTHTGATAANTNGSVSINLSNSLLDTNSLGLSSSGVVGANVTASSSVLSGALGDTTPTFDFSGSGFSGVQVTIPSGNWNTTTITDQNALVTQLNTAIAAAGAGNASFAAAGVQASVNSSGKLVFTSNQAFSVTPDAGAGGTAATALLGSATPLSVGASSTTQALLTPGANNSISDGDVLTFQYRDSSGNNQTATATLTTGMTMGTVISTINTATAGTGLFAVSDGAGDVVVMNANGGAFTMNSVAAAATSGIATGNYGSTNTLAGTSSLDILTTNDATSAITALNTAVANLGTIQGTVGQGENQLGYAINLAQSQNTNLSASEAQIRDADMASEAANLTKAQILVQAGVAALAQANSAPQAVLSLLKG